MTTPVLTLYTPAPAPVAAWRALQAALAAVLAPLARRRADRHARLALAELDDHLLRDLGLERGQIDAITAQPQGERLQRERFIGSRA
jgi:uncharacterized protein YjiS (DUF1127 family)